MQHMLQWHNKSKVTACYLAEFSSENLKHTRNTVKMNKFYQTRYEMQFSFWEEASKFIVTWSALHVGL